MIDLFDNLSTIQIVSLAVFASAILIQLFIYLYYYAKPLQYKFRKTELKEHPTHLSGVSVIIHACNDSVQLTENLPSILNQDYPNFEVIVVNDGSTDETQKALSVLESTHKNLYHTFLNEEVRNISRRKLSLTLGLKAAKHEIVLLTNSNCRPISNQWIASMMRNFTASTDIVIGYTRFKNRKGILERFYSYDTLLRALRLFGYTLKTKPYSAEGTNLAYRKALFFKNKGFSKHMHLYHGDDNLFINSVCNRANTRVEIAPEAEIIAHYDSNSRGWLQLKRNLAFTTKFYSSASKWIFAIESITRYLVYLSGFFMIPTHTMISDSLLAKSIIGILILRFLLISAFWHKVAKVFHTNHLTLLIPIFELITPICTLIFDIENLFRKKLNYISRI